VDFRVDSIDESNGQCWISPAPAVARQSIPSDLQDYFARQKILVLCVFAVLGVFARKFVVEFAIVV